MSCKMACEAKAPAVPPEGCASIRITIMQMVCMHYNNIVDLMLTSHTLRHESCVFISSDHNIICTHVTDKSK